MVGRYVRSDGNGGYLVDKSTFRWAIGTIITLLVIFSGLIANFVSAQNEIVDLKQSVSELVPRVRTVESSTAVMNQRLDTIDTSLDKIDYKLDKLLASDN